MNIHNLKIETELFEKKITGLKDWEIRKNDRDFKKGDILLFQEYRDDEYTVRMVAQKILDVFSDERYLRPSYVLLTCDKPTDIKVGIDFASGSDTCGHPSSSRITSFEYGILKRIRAEYKYLARDEDDSLYAYSGMPYKTDNGYLESGQRYMPLKFWSLFDGTFPYIRWEDAEPVSIKELIEEYEHAQG